MKKIALTQRLIKNDSYFEIREALDVNWGKLVNALGFEPLILSVEYDFKKLNFDGLILTGGNDLSSISGNDLDKKRDEFEKSLLDYCIKKGIPVFAICRGMQLINEYFGGTLKPIYNHAGTRHFLDNGQEVNSYHNFAVDKTGEGLLVVSESKDGIIEIIKHKNYRIFAQMSHPERENPLNKEEVIFIKEFFND